MSINKDFVEFKRDQPCPVCGHKQRCKASQSSEILCFGSVEQEVPGFRFLRHVRGCSTYLPYQGTVFFRSPIRRTKPPVPESNSTNLAARAKRYVEQLTDALAAKFAGDLGVSPSSLREVEAGFDGLRLCFFERNPDYEITAINVRYLDGTKRVSTGQRRGLTIPRNLAELPDPILVVEGASDVCACLTMGLAVVGRPSNAGGPEMLATLLVNRDVIVAGENDRKPNGLWPGRDGARNIAIALSRAWRHGARWAIPPKSKDIRAFLQENPGVEPFELGQKLLAMLRANAVLAHPNPRALRRVLIRKAVCCG